MSYIESINEKHKAIKGLNDDIWRSCEHLTTENGEALVNVPYKKLLGWLERRAAITREYEEKAWRSKADDLSRDLDTANGALEIAVKNETKLETRIADLQAELEKRDKGIARLRRQRDEAREQVAVITADRDACKKLWEGALEQADATAAAPSTPQGRDCQPMRDLMEECGEYERIADETADENAMLRDRLDGALALLAKLGEYDENIDIDDPDYYARCWAGHVRTIGRLQHELKRAEAERDALARDLADCNRQREELRDKLGIAIDYAHDVIELVNLDA